MASFPNSLEPVTGATENVGNAPDDENEDEDDYFDRLQSYVDAVDDDYKEDEDLEINAEKPTYHTEDEYFSAVLSANTSIESNLVLPEDSMVWTFLMRDIALSTVNKTHSGFTMVGPDDTSIIAITRQWLFNNLPSSSHLFCFIGVHMMNLVSANDTYNTSTSSSCSPTTCAADLCPYRLWVNDVTNPTIVLAVKFPAPSFRDNEINVSCFYDPSLEPGLNNLTADSNTHLVNWKSVCKEIVGTVESEWERIRYVRDESVLSPSKKTLSIMLAGVTHSFHHFFVECCGIVREEIKSTNPNRDCLSPNSSNHLVWNEEFFVPCGLFAADSMILAFEEEVEAPAGYSFTDLRFGYLFDVVFVFAVHVFSGLTMLKSSTAAGHTTTETACAW